MGQSRICSKVRRKKADRVTRIRLIVVWLLISSRRFNAAFGVSQGAYCPRPA